MQHIADAVRSHDAAALKKLFSTRAREKATDIDSGADYFLAVFPSARMTWKSVTTNSVYDFTSSKQTEELLAAYHDDPENVGLYALGVAPYTTDPYSAPGTKKPFYVWLASFKPDGGVATGIPGIFVPES
jgi:hypothetical protein